MKTGSVSMRRWLLFGAPVCGILNTFDISCASLFFTVWLILGIVKKDNDANCVYKRKAGPLRECARAFLLLSVFVTGLKLTNCFVWLSDWTKNWIGIVLSVFMPIGLLSMSEGVLRNRFSVRVNFLAGGLCLSVFFLLYCVADH